MMRRAFILFALVAMQAEAYDHPLRSHAIREAYFIGSGNYVERVAGYMAGYIKTLPVPKTGPHVAQMEVRTPFAQVIVSSREHSVGYSAQQAAQDYRKRPDTVQVRVQILNTATFALDSPVAAPQSACQGTQHMHSVEECFRDFQFRFTQEKEIKPKSSYGLSIHSDFALLGGDVWFVFRADDIASAPFRITVVTPDGQQVSAEFDLTALR
jgi:hypothetical protein